MENEGSKVSFFQKYKKWIFLGLVLLVIVAIIVVIILVTTKKSEDGTEDPPILGNYTVYAWGNNNPGILGLGTEDTSDVPEPQIITTLSDKKITQVVSGIAHSMAINSFGQLYVWGRNAQGQLGLGDDIDSNVPIELTTGIIFAKNIVYIACSDHSLAVDDSGLVYGWGRNSNGQLGLGGTNVDRNEPALVTAIQNQKIVKVACNETHSMMLDDAGNVYSCGANGSGQLGLGYASTPVNVPTKITTGFLDKIVHVSCGSLHSLALDASGRVYCWGYNFEGQIAKNTSFVSALDSPSQVTSGVIGNIVHAECGSSHCLAVDDSGILYAWGSNSFGQLGFSNIDFEKTDSILTVNRGDVVGKKIIQVSAGVLFSMALDDQGNVYVFGSNNRRQLGLPADIPFVIQPTLVSSGALPNKKIIQVECGFSSSFAIGLE